MAIQRPFRFGAAWEPESRQDLIEGAHKLEALGYDTMVLGEHPSFGGLAPLPALMAAAMVTTTLRFATHTLANDFRNPVMLAQEAATLDLLSGGRFELGIGTGWYREDYTSIGVAFDPPGVRVGRLAEALPLIKRLFREDAVTSQGTYYQLHEARLLVKPAQQPGPPIVIGGGGKRILSLAAREADIVSIDPIGTPEGTKDLATITAQALEQQIGWVRAAAGARFDALELHNLVFAVAVTDDRQRAAEQLAEFLADAPPTMMSNARRSAEEILASARFLIGSVDQIVEDLLARRERYGISYISVLDLPGLPSNIDTLAPVIARLAGS